MVAHRKRQTYDKLLHSPATGPSLAGSTGPFSKPCAGFEIPSSSQSTILANCTEYTLCIWLGPYLAWTLAGDSRLPVSSCPNHLELVNGFEGFTGIVNWSLAFDLQKPGDDVCRIRFNEAWVPGKDCVSGENVYVFFEILLTRPSSPPPAAGDSTMARPDSVRRISSNLMGLMSPSDIVGPSPVTSNGTETTEIEDDASDEIEQGHHGDLIHSSEVCLASRQESGCCQLLTW